jgi:AraC-like DNA-binding protein
MPSATTPAQYALILIDMVEESGCDRKQLLDGTSLSDKGIANLGARVNDSDFTLLANNALRFTGNPALGLHLGMRMNLSAHALVGQAFMTSRDLSQVLELFLRYQHILSSNLNVELEKDRQYCRLVTRDTPMEVSPTFSHELLYASILNTLRGLLNIPDLTLKVELPYPAPDHSEHYREIFGEEVYFDCPRGAVSLPLSLLSTPLPSSNAALRALYEQECSRLLADLEEEEATAEQTLRLLRKLEGQYPQMPQLAQMLNLSPRTYRRRLQQEGQSFQDLLDTVRAEHASRYLRSTRLPISTIAYLVGFNDASNFRRAYAKWTGRTPGEERNGR